MGKWERKERSEKNKNAVQQTVRVITEERSWILREIEAFNAFFPCFQRGFQCVQMKKFSGQRAFSSDKEKQLVNRNRRLWIYWFPLISTDDMRYVYEFRIPNNVRYSFFFKLQTAQKDVLIGSKQRQTEPLLRKTEGLSRSRCEGLNNKAELPRVFYLLCKNIRT
jgi:hypothetical protein